MDSLVEWIMLGVVTVCMGLAGMGLVSAIVVALHWTGFDMEESYRIGSLVRFPQSKGGEEV